jgi:hypothetical protein
MSKTYSSFSYQVLSQSYSIIVFLLIAIPLSAQEESQMMFSISAVEKNTTHFISKSNLKNYDANGNLGAGLLINIEHENPEFTSSNGIIKQSKSDDGWHLLVSENERIITVYAEGFLPFQIELKANEIELESGTYWNIEVAKKTLENSGDILKKLELVGFEKSLEILPTSDTDNYDVNGVLGVGIKIIMEEIIDEISFISKNGIVKEQIKKDHYLIVVSIGERTLTIQPKGFLPYTIIFSDKEIQLESGDIWNLELK